MNWKEELEQAVSEGKTTWKDLAILFKEEQLSLVEHIESKKVTGEDLAGLLSHIHTHAGIIHNNVKYNIKLDSDEVESEIYYSEKDLLKVLKAIGLPEPVWGKSISVEEYLKNK